MPSVIIINGKNPREKTGGYQTYTENLGKLLSEAGFDVKIVCFGKKKQILKTPSGEIHVITSALYNLPFIRSRELSGLIFLAPILAKYLLSMQHQNAVLFGIGPWSIAPVLLKLTGTVKNASIVSYLPTTVKHETSASFRAMRVHDYGFTLKIIAFIVNLTLVPTYSFLEQLIVSKSDFIVTHYKSIELILQRQFRVDPKKFVRLPYYIEPSKKTGKKHTAKIQTKNPLILLISRHDGRKGINYFLHALALLNERNISFSAVIAGSGELLKKNRVLAKRLHLTNVYIPGTVADISSLMKRCAVYAFPSVEEGSSSIAILEAMQERLPIVSTDVDGIPEDLAHNKTALLVKPYNAEALADGIETLLNNSKRAKRLGDSAKQAFLKKHDREKTKKALYIFIKNI